MAEAKRSENIWNEAQQRLDIARDYAQLFGTPQGQRVYADIFHRLCRVEEPLFAQNSRDGTAYNVGKRDVGVAIKKLIEQGGTFQPKPPVRT
jgi:hypothetical protein